MDKTKQKMKMTPSEAIVETLVKENVKEMYGILGSEIGRAHV